MYWRGLPWWIRAGGPLWYAPILIFGLLLLGV
jgi:hypothetical protein